MCWKSKCANLALGFVMPEVGLFWGFRPVRAAIWGVEVTVFEGPKPVLGAWDARPTIQSGTAGGSRTHTPLLVLDFESSASASSATAALSACGNSICAGPVAQPNSPRGAAVGSSVSCQIDIRGGGGVHSPTNLAPNLLSTQGLPGAAARKRDESRGH